MRHLSFRGGALAALLACPFALAHAAGSSTLEERMSYKEFTAYGLDKLSPQQLQGLNEWVQKHNAECVAAAAPAPGTAAAAPTAAANSGTVHSRLVGEFKGWEKGTVLVLENGQRWEVRDDEPVIGTRQQSPMVTVERGLVSGWRLSIEGASDVAHVVLAQPAQP